MGATDDRNTFTREARPEEGGGTRGRDTSRRDSRPGPQLRQDLLRTMLRIRGFEDAVGESHMRGLTAGSMLHLSVGEEAVAAGIGRAMVDGDLFTTHHRGHGIFIARGGELSRMMAEIYGRTDGYCRGKGGSMHIADIEYGHMGANAIVGGNIPISLGGGFALKYENKPNVSVAFFGDGALNQGILYEAMNMAALWDLPVMFAVVNNQYGMGTRVDRASACNRFAERAESFGVRGAEVDGMDVEKVFHKASELFEHSRAGKGPTLLVSECYRFYGHGRKDPSPYRTKEEEAGWKEKDPVESYARRLVAEGVLSENDVEAMRNETGKEVEAAVEFAKNSPVPEKEELFDHVYVDDWTSGTKQKRQGVE